MSHKIIDLKIIAVFILAAIPGMAVPADAGPQPILQESLEWAGPPDNPALKGAWVVGSEDDDDIYLFRVSLKQGGVIPPHTHPDTRNSTVLKGVLFVGFGTKIDETNLVEVPEGAVYTAPAKMPHYLIARDGDVIYQETGVGPTAVIPAARN